jgi:hypothetical protein
MKDTVFFKQAELLLRILPLIHKEEAFALKGGTAINFFIRELPRLSVDIDLTYLPVNERGFALDDISDGLNRISKEIKRRIPGSQIVLKNVRGTKTLKGMVVNQEGATVKIEPSFVLRGSVYPPEIKTLSKKAQDLFELSVTTIRSDRYPQEPRSNPILSCQSFTSGKHCRLQTGLFVGSWQDIHNSFLGDYDALKT